MTFQDIFKSNFLENVSSVSLLDMGRALVLAFGLGLFIFLIYKKTFAGVMYSSSFGVTLVGLTMITTLVILAVTSNVVLSLGMVGALSIVRFRAAIKEPLDIAFLFWAIAVGIPGGGGGLGGLLPAASPKRPRPAGGHHPLHGRRAERGQLQPGGRLLGGHLRHGHHEQRGRRAALLGAGHGAVPGSRGRGWHVRRHPRQRGPGPRPSPRARRTWAARRNFPAGKRPRRPPAKQPRTAPPPPRRKAHPVRRKAPPGRGIPPMGRKVLPPQRSSLPSQTGPWGKSLPPSRQKGPLTLG